MQSPAPTLITGNGTESRLTTTSSIPWVSQKHREISKRDSVSDGRQNTTKNEYIPTVPKKPLDYTLSERASKCVIHYAEELPTKDLLPSHVYRKPIVNHPATDIEFGLLSVDIKRSSKNWKYFEVWLTGVVDNGSPESSLSVRLKVDNWCTSFYGRVPDNWTPVELEMFQQSVNIDYKGNNRAIIQDITFDSRKRIFPFTNGKKDRLAKIRLCPNVFPKTIGNNMSKGYYRMNGEPIRIETFHHDDKPKTSFLFDSGLQLNQWVSAKNIRWNTNLISRQTTCQLEGSINIEDLCHLPLKKDVSIPFRHIWYDIETIAALAKRLSITDVKPYPRGKNKEDFIPMISLVVHAQGCKKPMYTMMLTLRSNPNLKLLPMENVDQIWCMNTPEELLYSFHHLYMAIDPDCESGFNTRHYDRPFILTQCMVRGLDSYGCMKWGRFKDEEVRSVRFDANIDYDLDLKYADVHIDGRIQFDLYQIVLKRERYSPYTLKNSCKQLLKKEHQDYAKKELKDCMSSKFKGNGYDLIAPFFFHGDEYSLSLLLEYCLFDSLAALQIAIDKQFFIDYAAQATLTNTDINDLVARGQQIRVYNKILEKIYKKGWYCNAEELIQWGVKTFEHLLSKGGKKKYSGGMVLEAKKGYYNTKEVEVKVKRKIRVPTTRVHDKRRFEAAFDPDTIEDDRKRRRTNQNLLHDSNQSHPILSDQMESTQPSLYRKCEDMTTDDILTLVDQEHQQQEQQQYKRQKLSQTNNEMNSEQNSCPTVLDRKRKLDELEESEQERNKRIRLYESIKAEVQEVMLNRKRKCQDDDCDDVSNKRPKPDDADDECIEQEVETPIRKVLPRCVAVLDFASLYPSIMMAHNLDYSTLVIGDEYANIEGIVYEEYTTSIGTWKFASNAKETILPELEQELVSARRVVKKEMERYEELAKKYFEEGKRELAEEAEFTALMLNKRQEALKIICNAAYGFTGVELGFLPCMPIGATVCFVGQGRIHQSKEYAEKNTPDANIECIYGDSVTGETPILLRFPDGHVDYVRIDSIIKNEADWTGYHQDKTSVKLGKDGQSFVEVFTEKGWTIVRRIIRHKTNKKLIRVLTDTGCVCVTEDHSLLDRNLNKIKPSEADIGQELLHCNIDEAKGVATNTLNSITLNKAKAWGTFFKTGVQDKGISLPREAFYDEHHTKKVPSEILNASISIQRAFLIGYGFTESSSSFYCSGQLASAGLFFLFRKLGYTVRLDWFEKDEYKLNVSNDPFVDQRINRLEPLQKTDEYVFDLETESHHFSAGVGQLVVHNTDSIMIVIEPHRYNECLTDIKEDHLQWRKACFTIGRRLAKEITDLIGRAPLKIEFEKIGSPFMLFSKKQYVLEYWSDEKTNKDKLSMKGISAVKRDWCLFTQTLCKDILNSIMREHASWETVVQLWKSRIDDLVEGRVPLHFLVLTKKLSEKPYANEDAIVQMAVVKKMKARNPSRVIEPGMRVMFVITKQGKPSKKKNGFILDGFEYDLQKQADEYEYVDINRIPLDLEYYLDRQVIRPVRQILDLAYPMEKVNLIEKQIYTQVYEKNNHLQSHLTYQSTESLIVKLSANQSKKVRYM